MIQVSGKRGSNPDTKSPKTQEEFSDCRIEAIRLGGGTASIMSGSDFDYLCRQIRERYDEAENPPVTMRCSQADINGANRPFYNRNHVSRCDLERYLLEPRDFIHLDYLNYMEQLPYISSGFLYGKSQIHGLKSL